ncbi:MAG TPA: transcriptional regulator [Rhodospirillaceae bacterium]|nr:helix-turn-helix transcriptional regulator [Alphaproteobacteria bacterium]HBH25937.1 transcriptional regulator [Rhodospirillaceae bacterium]
MAAHVDKKKTKGSADLLDRHVGKRLRVRRALLGMSQEKLADAIGLTFQQIQKYERGTNRISASRLYQFSQILDVPVTYFYERVGDVAGFEEDERDGEEGALGGLSDGGQESLVDDRAMGVNEMLERRETLDLIRYYYTITDTRMRRDILRFVKAMAERAKG